MYKCLRDFIRRALLINSPTWSLRILLMWWSEAQTAWIDPVRIRKSSLDHWHPCRKCLTQHSIIMSGKSDSCLASHLSRLLFLRISVECKTHHPLLNLSMFRRSHWSWSQLPLFHTCRTPARIPHFSQYICSIQDVDLIRCSLGQQASINRTSSLM